MRNTFFSRAAIQAALAALLCAGAGAQHSAYLAEPGQLLLTPSYVYSYYDDAWIGKTSMPIEQDQHSVFLGLEYGITDWLSADLLMGYSWAEIEGAGSDDGLSDTFLGLKARILDEDAGAPFQLALRVGGIIPGTYDDAFPFSVGDGAAGVEGSLLIAKTFCPWFSTYGDFGYRWRDDDVPQELFASGGVSFSFGRCTLSAGYRGFWGLEGGDIGGKGFGVDYGFPQTKEVQHNLEVSFGITDPGDRFYQVFYSRTLDGRNTGEHNVFGVAVTFPFGGRAEPEPVQTFGKNPARSSK